MQYVFDAVSQIRKTLWTGAADWVFRQSVYLACYMIEGGGSDDFRLTKTMLFRRPDLLHDILRKNTQSVIAYLNAQIDAGAQARDVVRYLGGYACTRRLQRVFPQVRSRDHGRPKTNGGWSRGAADFLTKGGGLWLESMVDCGADALACDWTIDLADAKRRVGGKVALQGNLDPSTLFAPPAIIEQEARRVLREYAADGDANGHVFNLGHGISQFTDPTHVEALVKRGTPRQR